MTIEERFEKISLDWFLVEPALFKVLCSHKLMAETGMKCPVRCGQRRIEYNSDICTKLNDVQLAEHLKAECIRILLKHPYDRQPDDCDPMAITMGSNCVLGENYNFRAIKMEKPEDLGIEPERYFEVYAKDINRMIDDVKQMMQKAEGTETSDNSNSSNSSDNSDSSDSSNSSDNSDNSNSSDSSDSSDSSGSSGSSGSSDDSENSDESKVSDCSDESKDSDSSEDSGGSDSSDNSKGSSGSDSSNSSNNSNGNASLGRTQALSDASGLWQEDAMASAEVNEMIHQMEASNQWGSIPGNLVGQIIASTKVKIDYRRVMQSFRSEVLSSKRRLTRMRPNRRSGFQNFGSVYRLSSRLLIAIDVSGSTTDEMVSEFFGIVNKFFKYGIEEIDVIQFDTEIKGEPVTMKKAARSAIDITGRGGTSFQPVFDYATEQKNYYQGLVIFTDGWADEPKPADYFRTPVLWVLPSENEYERHKEWMEKTGQTCFITY